MSNALPLPFVVHDPEIQANFDAIAIAVGRGPTRPEAWHVVGATGEPAFQNSWVSFDGPPSFMKDPFGFVHLMGAVQSGTLTLSAFTLPAGYRPLTVRRFATISNVAFGDLRVGADGKVIPNAGSNAWFQFDNAIFRAEQ